MARAGECVCLGKYNLWSWKTHAHTLSALLMTHNWNSNYYGESACRSPSITGAQVTRNTGNTHNTGNTNDTGNTIQAKHSTTLDKTQIMQQKQRYRQRIYETQTTLYQATLITQIITGKKKKQTQKNTGNVYNSIGNATEATQDREHHRHVQRRQLHTTQATYSYNTDHQIRQQNTKHQRPKKKIQEIQNILSKQQRQQHTGSTCKNTSNACNK